PGVPVLARGDHLRRHRGNPAQHSRPPPARPGKGVTVDAAERDLLAQTLRKTMLAASGQVLDRALTELGWADLLAGEPAAISLVFRLLGETGTHAPLINDVLLTAAGQRPGG